jgi:taurine--2-oxoglutarate transaminase
MSEQSIKTNHSAYNLQSWSKQKGLDPVVIEKAEGIYMWDPSGKRYSDMSSQLVNLNLGHGNKANERAASDYYAAKLREQVRYENPSAIAAIILETVTGSNGVIIPPEGYLRGVRNICDEFGILLICDEVMMGFGRTGKMFSFEHWGIAPDIITFAKGSTCGYVQLGGVAVTKTIAAHFDDTLLSCGLTYSGHPLACAAGIATVNYYREHKILDNVRDRGAELAAALAVLKDKHKSVGDVRSIGLMSAVELVKDRETKEPLVPYGRDPDGTMKRINSELAQRGFMTYTHENMILVAPPLVITAEQLGEELVKLDEVLGLVDAML